MAWLVSSRHRGGLRYLDPERLYWLDEGYASPQDDYVSSNLSSTAGHRCSKSPSLWSPRFNRAWIRCCVSGQVSAVSKEVMRRGAQSADGNETWLTRFFAAAMARPVEGGDPARERVDEAVQFGVWKCPVDVSVSFRGVAVEVVRAEDNFKRPTAADQMWEAFRTATTWMQSHPDFGLTQSRVLARRKTHIAGEDELAAHAPDTASDLRDADHRGLDETHERIRQDREARSPRQQS